jgi:Transposase DDE domain
MRVTPHVAQNHARPGGSAIDSRTTRHSGYDLSQRKRKRIEECFGWLKTIALMRKVRHRGVCKVDWIFTFACAVYNLVRHAKPDRHSSRGVSQSRSVSAVASRQNPRP